MKFFDEMRALIRARETETGSADEITRRAYAAIDAAEVDHALHVDRLVFGNSYAREVADPDAPGGVRRERVDPATVVIRRKP
jgi:hypothetical protein